MSAVRTKKPPKPSKKAKAWAKAAPEERARIYYSMSQHLIEVADLLGDDAEAGEAKSLREVARQFGAATAKMHRAKALRETCCWQQLQFGSCKGHADG